MARLFGNKNEENKKHHGYKSDSPEFDYEVVPMTIDLSTTDGTPNLSYKRLAVPNHQNNHKKSYMNRRKTPAAGVNEKKLKELRESIEFQTKPRPSTKVKRHPQSETLCYSCYNLETLHLSKSFENGKCWECFYKDTLKKGAYCNECSKKLNRCGQCAADFVDEPISNQSNENIELKVTGDEIVNDALYVDEYDEINTNENGCCVSVFFGKMFGGLCNNNDAEVELY